MISYSNYSSLSVDMRLWLTNGVTNSELIGVYFSLGATDKAESLKNILNPGTGDMIESGTVKWDKAVGWYDFSADNFLTGPVYKTNTYSFIIVADHTVSIAERRIFSCEGDTAGDKGSHLVANVNNTNGRILQGNISTSIASQKLRGVFGASQTGIFIDGTKTNSITTGGDEVSEAFTLGNRNHTPHADYAFRGRIQAVFIYNTSLSDAQMISIQNNLSKVTYFRDFSNMVKYTGNPLITKGEEAWRADSVGVPYVQPDCLADDGYYYAFVACSSGNWVWNTLALFRSNDLLNWQPYGSNPVVSSVPDTWEEQFMSHPCPIKIGDVHYLYYTSSDSGNKSRLGRLISSDLKIWARDEDNPLYEDPVSNVHSAWLVKFGTTYYLYYRRDNQKNSTIHYATSPDALTFTYRGTCFLTVVGDIDYDRFALDPFVWQRSDSIYEMVYVSCWATTDIQKINYAISSDGINFFKRSQWILEGTMDSDDWDCGILGVPILFKISSTVTYMYYCGAKDIISPFSQNSGGLAIIPN